MADKTIKCWSCKEEVEVEEKLTRQDECPNCEVPLKCCFNCIHYDKDAFHKCKESAIAEWVRYKEKANLCDYHKPRYLHLMKKPIVPKTPVDRKNSWDQLFED